MLMLILKCCERKTLSEKKNVAKPRLDIRKKTVPELQTEMTYARCGNKSPGISNECRTKMICIYCSSITHASLNNVGVVQPGSRMWLNGRNSVHTSFVGYTTNDRP